MVGLQVVKQDMTDFVIRHLQATDIQLPNMRHMIIAGPPGCGKTTLSTIVAKLLSRMDLCETETVVYGTQANLIGGYLGQTAPKTEELIRSAFGGVLVIDEASSLADGRTDTSSDSFAKSCIDTLNRMLSEHGDEFVCILAGYKEEIHRDILSINPGMDRRFATRFEILPYTDLEIMEIIRRQFLNRKVTLEGSVLLDWIRDHRNVFKNAGGDCMRLVDTVILSHAKRTFGQELKNTVTQADIDAGLAVLVDRAKANGSPIPEYARHMYT